MKNKQIVFELVHPSYMAVQYHTGGNPIRTIVVDTFTEGGTDYILSAKCLEVDKSFNAPLYTPLNIAKFWLQNLFGSEVEVKKNIKVN